MMPDPLTEEDTTIRERLARLEGRYDRHEERLDDIDEDVAGLKQQIRNTESMLLARIDESKQAVGAKIDTLRGEVVSALITNARMVTPNIVWIVGSILGVCGLVIGVAGVLVALHVFG